MTLYDRIGDLDVTIDGWDLDRRVRDTSSGFERVTTVISLHGDGEVGRGEDVTYEADEHHSLIDAAPDVVPTGATTHREFAAHVGDTDLFFGRDLDRDAFRDYRRWAFESAALDLALRQADTDLASALDREYDEVRFVASTRLGDPPTFDRVEAFLDRDPALEFKLDPTSDWSTDLIERLADTGRVRVLDLKGQYRGTSVDQAADPDLYERVIEGVPDATIEDPALTEETRPLFDGHEERVSWDAPIHGVETVESLPWEPSVLNVKPSRFGSVESLFETIEYCREHDIECYGGGQFELDVGREHLHALASLFYPDAPNDVAPRAYNDPDLAEDLPTSPLAPPSTPTGLGWR
ncbi:enolase-like domain-containing protein [Halococcus agarilyticus]|uniref:enolase n=1 Tax=Halococcus agarilyticus TaxID=1232219 RepID=UPI000677AE5D|nr:enolase [Halococcus agarilyticus]